MLEVKSLEDTATALQVGEPISDNPYADVSRDNIFGYAGSIGLTYVFLGNALVQDRDDHF